MLKCVLKKLVLTLQLILILHRRDKSGIFKIQKIFGEKIVENKMCSFFPYNNCQAFPILRRNERDMTINVQRSACKVQLLCEMLMELGYCDRTSKEQ
jgi:hypothetical protein